MNQDQIAALRVILLNEEKETKNIDTEINQTITMEIPKTKSIKKQEGHHKVFLDARNDAWHKMCFSTKNADKITSIVLSKGMIIPFMMTFILYSVLVIPSILPSWYQIMVLTFFIILCVLNCLSFNIAIMSRMLITFEFMWKFYNILVFMICRAVIYQRFNLYDATLFVCTVVLVCITAAHDGWNIDKIVRIIFTLGVCICSIGYYIYWFDREEFDYKLTIYGRHTYLRQILLNSVFNLALFFGTIVPIYFTYKRIDEYNKINK